MLKLASSLILVLSLLTPGLSSAQEHIEEVRTPQGSGLYKSCAVNCLYIVTQLRGLKIPISKIEKLLAPRPNGDCSVADIERAARTLGLDVLSLDLNRKDLDKLPPESIVLLKSHAATTSSNHFVVYMGKFKRGAVTIDPPNAATYHGLDEFLGDFSGVAIAFPETQAARSTLISSIKRKNTWPNDLFVILACLASVALALWGFGLAGARSRRMSSVTDRAGDHPGRSYEGAAQ